MPHPVAKEEFAQKCEFVTIDEQKVKYKRNSARVAPKRVEGVW
jgi:hypothetical protein